MPKGIYNRTKSQPRPKCSFETKKKISLSEKGKFVSKETREKMRGKKFPNRHHDKQFKKGQIAYNKGKPLLKIRGKLHWNWQGGISTETETIRHSLESKLWQDSVKNIDCNCCQKCGETRISKLTAHHIQNFSSHPELRFAIDNGITFCRPCHKKFHMKYGFRNNSREQIIEFLNQ